LFLEISLSMDSLFDDPESIDKLALEQIHRDFFDHNPIQIKVELEGQRLAENGDFILGCRAGPSIHICNLYHEMAHFAERELAKIVARPPHNWGFEFGKYWEIAGQSGHEPQTDQSVKREMRCWAYQLSIENHYGIHHVSEWDEDLSPSQVLAQSAIYMPAFALYQNKVISQNERDILGYSAAQKKAIEILAEEIRQLSENEFTFARFCEAWFERMEALK